VRTTVHEDLRGSAPGNRTFRRPTRPVVVTVLALLLCVAVVLLTMATGPLPVTPIDVLRTIAGQQPDNEFAVLTIGLPRATLALLIGIGLGAAGALMQAQTRNPLGSPDIIGFTNGAAAGAVIALIPFHQKGLVVSLAALVGGLVTAAAVFALAGGASRGGYRLIVIGIGVSALLTGVTYYLLSRANLSGAMDAQRWLSGSLNDADWNRCVIMLVAVVVLLPVATWLRRPLLITQLGDEVSHGLGVRLHAIQGLVIAVAVLLAAAAVTTAGPIGFIALAAPQIALRLARRPAPLVLTSAAVGALLMVLSDLLAQRALGSVDVPVGITTGVVGGLYLAWLLSRMWKQT